MYLEDLKHLMGDECHRNPCQERLHLFHGKQPSRKTIIKTFKHHGHEHHTRVINSPYFTFDMKSICLLVGMTRDRALGT